MSYVLIKRQDDYRIIDSNTIRNFDLSWIQLSHLTSIDLVKHKSSKGGLKYCRIIAISGRFKLLFILMLN
jgi:hypothetical protein